MKPEQRPTIKPEEKDKGRDKESKDQKAKTRNQTALSIVLGLAVAGAGLSYGVSRMRERPPAPAQVMAPEPAPGAGAPGSGSIGSGSIDDPGAQASAPEEPAFSDRAAKVPSSGAGAGASPGPAESGGTVGAPAAAPEESAGAAAVSGDGKGAASTVTIKMDPLVANLDEGDQLRYLKISLQIEVVPEAQQRAQQSLPKARHDALMYMSGLHLSDTQGLLGKQRIHRELQRRIADAIGGGMKRIYFDEFVVQ